MNKTGNHICNKRIVKQKQYFMPLILYSNENEFTIVTCINMDVSQL